LSGPPAKLLLNKSGVKPPHSKKRAGWKLTLQDKKPDAALKGGATFRPKKSGDEAPNSKKKGDPREQSRMAGRRRGEGRAKARPYRAFPSGRWWL